METKFALKFPKSTDLSSLIKITNIINTNILRYLFSNCTDIGVVNSMLFVQTDSHVAEETAQ